MFTDFIFKLTLEVRTKPITVYSKIPLSKNLYHVETGTGIYMIQVIEKALEPSGYLGVQNQLRSKLIIKTPVRRLYC